MGGKAALCAISNIEQGISNIEGIGNQESGICIWSAGHYE
jgi:hypothetical protein